MPFVWNGGSLRSRNENASLEMAHEPDSPLPVASLSQAPGKFWVLAIEKSVLN